MKLVKRFQQAGQVPTRTQTVRRSREKGSAILEAAFVFLPLLALFFALMDYSVAMFVQNTLRNAVREGVRFAISQQTGAGGQDLAVKNIVKNNSMGFLVDNTRTSITYYDPTLTVVNGTGSNAAGNICLVSVTGFPWSWFAPLGRSATALSFTANSSDVMEAPPNGVLPSR